MDITIKPRAELMKMIKPNLIDYVVTTIRDLTRDRNWHRNKKNEYQKLYAHMVKEDKSGYVLREDHDGLRAMNNNQSNQINRLTTKVHALKAALKEVL